MMRRERHTLEAAGILDGSHRMPIGAPCHGLDPDI
jgi:hypothetical protein